jgi:hypothetical protein
MTEPPDFAGLRTRMAHYADRPVPPRLARACASALARVGYRIRKPLPLVSQRALVLALLVAEVSTISTIGELNAPQIHSR